MAKKLKIFSQISLGVMTALTLGYAANFSANVFACGSDVPDENGNVTNCVEVEAPTDGEALPLVTAEDAGEETYFDADDTLTSEKSVFHSLFLAGSEVTSRDFVQGLNFVAGNLVELAGNSEYALLAGNSIKISGSVEKDLFVAGNAIELTDEAFVGRDIFAVGNTMLIKSNLYGNAYVAGNRLVLENVTIDGNLDVDFEEIVVKGKSSVAGTFSYNENAVITGLDDLSTGETKTHSANVAEINVATTLEEKFFFLLGRIVLTAILIALAPSFAKKLLETFSWKSSWKHLGLGLGLIALVPLCAVFAMITLIGLPLGIFAMALWGAFIYLSTSVTGGVLGDQILTKLFKKPKTNIDLKYCLGILLITLLGFIPVVGGLVSAISVCFGFGYLSHRLFKKAKK
ncbi:hypothetical protein IJ380_02445 [Candidatus Saccharibacteria bacterium]|nr:hypothetical protein [Candidatus Saccharibacteria bacterium]